MLDLSRLDLDEIAQALSDQTDYEHRWLINPETGEIVFWPADTGIDDQGPVDLDDLDLIAIDPLPSYIWYQDMADFAEQIQDERAGRRLARAIPGKGAFRRFKDELHEEYPHLLPAWYAVRDARAFWHRPLWNRRLTPHAETPISLERIPGCTSAASRLDEDDFRRPGPKALLGREFDWFWAGGEGGRRTPTVRRILDTGQAAGSATIDATPPIVHESWVHAPSLVAVAIAGAFAALVIRQSIHRAPKQGQSREPHETWWG